MAKALGQVRLKFGLKLPNKVTVEEVHYTRFPCVIRTLSVKI